MKPKHIKKLLMDEIKKVSQSIEQYCFNPMKDFTRTRKLPIEKLMLGIIGMESKSITNELLNYYDISPETPTASAFVQQRNKLKPEAFESVFKGFSQSLCFDGNIDFPMFAIDGSDIQIATNPNDPSSYFPGANGQKDYNLLHLNALYNLDRHIYVDAVIQNRRDANEHKVTFDFLPQSSRKNEPTLFYELKFRVVRFQISDDTYETILTNLDRMDYPPDKIKELYALRWGIETSFRNLKYTVGMLNFHSKKTACIKQEIYSHLIMYNFAETVTSQVSIRKKQTKHTYRANFSVAVHICRLYYRNKVTLSVLESIIAKNLIPIRLGRLRDRALPKKRAYHGFLYRVA